MWTTPAAQPQARESGTSAATADPQANRTARALTAPVASGLSERATTRSRSRSTRSLHHPTESCPASTARPTSTVRPRERSAPTASSSASTTTADPGPGWAARSSAGTSAPGCGGQQGFRLTGRPQRVLREQRDLIAAPRADRATAVEDRRAEVRPVHPGRVLDLGGVRGGCLGRAGDEDGAHLVLDDTVGHHGAVAEGREHQRHPLGPDADLGAHPASYRVGDRLARWRMPADTVAPGARPSGLGAGASGHQQSTAWVEEIAGERQ